MDDFSHFFEVVNDAPISQDEFLNRRRMDLQCQSPRYGVPPDHRQSFDFLLLDGREVGGRELEVLGNEPKAISPGFRLRHPDVGVWGVLDFCAADESFVGVGEEVVHFVGGDEDRAAAGEGEGVGGVGGGVGIEKGLVLGFRDRDGHERRHARGVQVVKRGVDVPAVETRKLPIHILRDGSFVESRMMRMLQGDVLQPFKLLHRPVSNDLHLWLMRDSLQVGMEDGFFLAFAVAVGLHGGVEEASKFVLRFGGEGLLVLEEDDLVFVEGATNYFEVGLGEVLEVGVVDFGAEVVGGALWRLDGLDGDFGLDCHLSLVLLTIVESLVPLCSCIQS